MISKIKNFLKQNKEMDDFKTDDYFSQATSWADEFYTSVVTSRNKWRALSLFILSPVIFLLLICMSFLIPSQHLEPLMINHYQDGETIVTPLKQDYAPHNSSQVKSDIVRYIRYRESYSPATYDYAYRLIHLMSAPSVYSGFQEKQSIDNKKSPINTIGKSGYKTVKIESIVFLDNEDRNIQNKSHGISKNKNQVSGIHQNLAQVDFLVLTHNNQTNQVQSKPLTALISWGYRKTSSDPVSRWMDWSGFTVTSYQVVSRNA